MDFTYVLQLSHAPTRTPACWGALNDGSFSGSSSPQAGQRMRSICGTNAHTASCKSAVPRCRNASGECQRSPPFRVPARCPGGLLARRLRVAFGRALGSEPRVARLRKQQVESEPVICVAASPQPSSVILGDRTGDRQPHPQAITLGREEGLEELLEVMRTDPRVCAITLPARSASRITHRIASVASWMAGGVRSSQRRLAVAFATMAVSGWFT